MGPLTAGHYLLCTALVLTVFGIGRAWVWLQLWIS